MIRDVSELLSQILQDKLQLLDGSKIIHGPTIGDMYEGLSADILNRAIPGGLGLKVVTGFATDGTGNLSGQLDCMLVRDEGEPIPYTSAGVWHVKDIIAVIEVKKTLRGVEMMDAITHLKSIKDLETNWIDNTSDSTRIDVGSAIKAFVETTGLSVRYDEVSNLPVDLRMIFRTLLREQISTTRIVLGLHGFKTESGMRAALASIIERNIGAPGFSPGDLPQLIISGGYSLLKANGRPYSAPLTDKGWPFYGSSPANPLLLLLEFIWTRLDELFDFSELWGEDLDLEVVRALLVAKAEAEGWHIAALEATKRQLDAIPISKAWSPAFLTIEEFVVLNRLCAGENVAMDDPELLGWLGKSGVDPQALQSNLIATRLVAMQGQQFKLIARECQCAILPSGEYVAAENNTGRFTRWLTRRIDEAMRTSAE